jgi:hypothetical protein
MATARGKTSPDVALLLRRVQMDERFRVETKGSHNKVNITGPLGEPLIVSLDADTGDVRRAERALERMGLRSADQPVERTRSQRVTTKPATDPYPNITIYEKARKVWKGATDYAKAKGVAVGLYDGVEYFIIDDKPLKYFIGKHYPKIQHYSGPGGTQEIYDFLRATGNYAREREEDDMSVIIVRCEFAEAGGPVIFRSPRSAVSDWQREQARKEAKLTPHEAGEDREPGPVTVRRKPVAKPVETPEEIVERIVIDDPEPVVQTPTTEVAPADLEDVNEAFEMLQDTLKRAIGHLDHSACEGDLAAANQEAQYQRADAAKQRLRAEAAEQTLHLIWLAFSEMPQHKAVSEILPLLPPLKP